MHEDFSDWFRVVSIRPNADELEKRWEGVEAYSKDCSLDELIELARFFHRLQSKDAAGIEKFKKPFKDADPAFLMGDNDEELRVLAGTCLVWHLANDDLWGCVSALLLTCPTFSGHAEPAVEEMVGLGENYLRARSAKLRSPKSTRATLVSEQSVTQVTSAGEALAAKFAGGGQLQQAATESEEFFKQLATLLGQVRKTERSLDASYRLVREELQVLWWVFGGHSDRLGVALRDLPPMTVSFIIGKELALLAGTIPGPHAAAALLDRALTHKKGKALDGAIANMLKPLSSDAIELILENLDGGAVGLCPLTLAVQQFQECGKRPAWKDLYQDRSSLDVEAKLSLTDVAFQMFREGMLLRTIDALREDS